VPKLLAIARKLRTLSRRLVTDAGGAPCCCSPGDACPCDPALRFAAFRAETCVGGRRGGVEASGPARIAIVRLQWAVAWETFEESQRGTPAFAAIAQRGSSVGTAQWCVIHSASGQIVPIWILSAAQSAFEYQQQATGRSGLPDDESTNYLGTEALQYPVPWTGRTNRGTWQTIVNSAVAGRWVSVPAVPQILAPSLASPDFGACVFDVSSSGGGQVERVRGAFASGASGGTAAYNLTYTSGNSSGLTRQATETQAAWSIRYLTCESGGPDQLRPEGGCSNCGDRATLEPFV